MIRILLLFIAMILSVMVACHATVVTQKANITGVDL